MVKKNITPGFSFFLITVSLLFLCGCKKNENVIAFQQTGTMTDIDGNTYKTIKIGNQWWMTENLKVRKFRNGIYIFSVTSNPSFSIWDTLTKGGLCNYNYIPISTTGCLYNWYAVNDTNNIAPQGWHIPTDEEWQQLEEYLGMSQADASKIGWRGTHEGEKLKQQGENYWKPYNDIWATNESGFTGLAGGCRMFNGTSALNEWSSPLDQQSTGFWWTSSEKSANEAFYRYLDYKNANVFRDHGNKNYGFSIRCVKD